MQVKCIESESNSTIYAICSYAVHCKYHSELTISYSYIATLMVLYNNKLSIIVIQIILLLPNPYKPIQKTQGNESFVLLPIHKNYKWKSENLQMLLYSFM